MTILFYNAPAAAAIPIPVWPAAAPPLPAPPVWPGVAVAPVPSMIGLLQIAQHAALDMRPHAFSPISTPSLIDIFNSITLSVNIAGASKLVTRKRFQHYSSSWKRLFSEVIATGTSLSVADQHYGYPYFVPLEFCRGGVYAGRPSWPAAISALVPNAWHVQRLWQNVLMPDYVIARPNPAGNWNFSTLEAKGRNQPVHTGSYANYSQFKTQSMNARLEPVVGAPAAPIGFTANFLNITAIRPKLKTYSGRVIRARWFNNRPADMLNAPPTRWGIELAASHYGAMLYQLGMKRLGNAIASCLLRNIADQRLIRLQNSLFDGGSPEAFGLKEVAGGTFVKAGLTVSPLTAILAPGTFQMLVELSRALRKDDEDLNIALSRKLFEHNERTSHYRENNERLQRLGRRVIRHEAMVSLSSSGIGLICPTFHDENEDD